MIRQRLDELNVKTRGRGFYEITKNAAALVEGSSLQTGILTLHLCHTSASLLIQENADPEVRRDLERFFSRLIPDGDALFRHTSEGDDDMPAHVRTALTAVNLSIHNIIKPNNILKHPKPHNAYEADLDQMMKLKRALN